MSYYVLPDYWVAGYAEGDAVEVSAVLTPSLSLSASVNGVANLSATLQQFASMSSSIGKVLSVDVSDVSASANFSSQMFYTKSISAEVVSDTSFSANAVGVFVGASDISPSVALDMTLNRVVGSSANIDISCIITASSRFYWIKQSDTQETWTVQADTQEVWSPQQDTAETWERVQ